jgi:hypothetical protein
LILASLLIHPQIRADDNICSHFLKI